ncbi:MAG: iron-only hydrogenase system regulator [Lachnospiraceae bacterium]|nr:iron-only hydrogenase system regulator [Lachnospiraceae bacterium]
MDDESRLALIGIVITEPESTKAVNEILHAYADYIIGRMGIPYKKKNLSVISIAIDASTQIISSLSGKLGMLSGVAVKTMYSK